MTRQHPDTLPTRSRYFADMALACGWTPGARIPYDVILERSGEGGRAQRRLGEETMRYVFGAYSLDTQCYELRRVGELIPLGPQVFNVLAYLVAHRDRVVSRDELFARLWPDQFVTNDALGRCIRAARRALEDRSEAPRYITTTRGRGYRFIAPAQEQPHGPPEGGASTVPAQSLPQPLSMAGSEGAPLPVSLSAASGALQHASEEFLLPSAGEYGLPLKTGQPVVDRVL